MARLRFRLPSARTLIVLWIVALLLFGAVAWGIGWTAHSLVDRPSTPTSSTATARPMQSATAVLVASSPAAPSPSQPTVHATSTLQPTATAASEAWETVRSGEGLYQVCRRHCSDRWPPDDDDLTRYAEEVTRLNGLSWPNPLLSEGQRLRMPPCP